MEASFERIVVEALDALESGEDVETIVARYPEQESELRPILLTTSSLTNIRVAHSLEAQAASRQRMLDYAAASAVAPRRNSSPIVLLRRLSLAMAALLVIVALSGSGVFFASSEAVPGDALYEAKRFFEDTRLSLTGDAAASEELRQQFEGLRTREIQTLLRMGRSEEVEFSGIIEAIEGNIWVVAGLELVVMDTTTIAGVETPSIGSLVQVKGVTTDGRVNALVVNILTIGNVPESIPENELTKTPVVGPSPSATATPSPTATQTPTATPTAEETPPEESLMPTSTPTPESNENGNANGNENEGGGNANDNSGESNGNQSGNSNSGSNGGEGNDNDNEDNENEGNSNNDNDNDEDDEEENENDERDNDNENRNKNSS